MYRITSLKRLLAFFSRDSAGHGRTRRTATVLGGPHPVRGIAISPDKSMVAASRGNQIHIYDAGSGTFIRTLIDPQLSIAD